MGKKIKGANWLTALSDDCLQPIGGRAALLAQLDENFHIFEYEGGVLIQAGATPQLGDVNRQQIPGDYRHLSKILKPIRMTFPKDEYIFPDINGRDGTEITNEWLARFDD
jgi:hypothetical protein